MAGLSALGLLDDEERDQFEHALRAADPQIQAQIRREQLLYSTSFEEALPDVDVPPGLRARVLAAVRRAIDRVASTDRPLVIGALPRHRTMLPVWRAACIGFATATVVLGAFFVQLNRTVYQMAEQTQTNFTLAELQQTLGARGLALFSNPNAHEVGFIPVADTNSPITIKARAVLRVDPETRQAFLICADLPIAAGEYQLVIEGPDNSNTVAHKFRATGGIVPVEIRIENLDELTQLAIVGPVDETGQQRVLLRPKSV
ncbi:MAG: hypothetical protein EA380_00075 [Phycisphaeraceae bacterium]|nr:MAG: hypothetical protein EA380_00075 [Phycisphaeraceae bacterium]